MTHYTCDVCGKTASPVNLDTTKLSPIALSTPEKYIGIRVRIQKVDKRLEPLGTVDLCDTCLRDVLEMELASLQPNFIKAL